MARTARTLPRRLRRASVAFVLVLSGLFLPLPEANAAEDPTTLVVTYRSADDAAPVARVAERVGDVRGTTPRLERIAVVVDDVTSARRTLAATRGVTSVIEDVQVRALNLSSWNLGGRGTYPGASNAYAAQSTTTGVGVTVAVIDTGVDANPDLPASRVLTGFDAVTGRSGGGDGEGHGTHVAGTVAQAMGDTFGADSVAPGATILPVRALTSAGTGSAFDVADGIDWAVAQGAKILNLSLGAPNNASSQQILCPAVDEAVADGVTVIAAVGNAGAATALYPAACDNAIPVGAVGSTGALASYSNRTPGMIVAPGGSGLLFVRQMTIDKSNSSWENPALRTYTVQGRTGTSMAAPHVAGAVALMRSVNPTLTPARIRFLLFDSAIFGVSGYRQLDVAAAVNAARLPRWRAESLDGTGMPAGSGRATGASVGGHSATVIHDNAPHVFYTDTTNGRLRHAWWTGTTWFFEDLDGPDVPGGRGRSPNRVGEGASALVYAGGPHVWYLDESNGRLRHAWWTGAEWFFEDLDSSAEFVDRTAAVLFAGEPHVWYHDETNGRLRHAWWTGRTWLFEDLDGADVPGGLGRSATDVGSDASVVVFQGGPHVWYRDATNGRLRHAWWAGTAWYFEDLDGSGVPGGVGRVDQPTGLTTASILYAGAPHVWYQPADGSALRHAWWTGTRWAFESNDTAAACGTGCTPGTHPSVVLYAGAPHVFHGTGGTGNLRHSWWTGSRWAVENLDGPGTAPADGTTSSRVGVQPSVVLYGGFPHVFHASGDLGHLRHSWYG